MPAVRFTIAFIDVELRARRKLQAIASILTLQIVSQQAHAFSLAYTLNGEFDQRFSVCRLKQMTVKGTFSLSRALYRGIRLDTLWTRVIQPQNGLQSAIAWEKHRGHTFSSAKRDIRLWQDFPLLYKSCSEHRIHPFTDMW